jgi:hypothetical protein
MLHDIIEQISPLTTPTRLALGGSVYALGFAVAAAHLL